MTEKSEQEKAQERVREWVDPTVEKREPKNPPADEDREKR